MATGGRGVPRGVPVSRIFAVGCSHGHLLNRDAAKAVIEAKRKFKPEITLHLGDFLDMTAFRSGAAGTGDDYVSLSREVRDGFDFLRELQPTHILIGNHEHRLWRALTGPAIGAHAASCIIQEMRKVADELGAELLDRYHIARQPYFEFGGYKWLHGFMYNENALRDHAEHFGNCVIAHLHKPGIAYGRRDGGARALCVGTLADIPALEYAGQRRATAQWGHGYVCGEFGKKGADLQLCEIAAR